MNKIISLAYEHRDILKDTGWVISEPFSFAWWDGFDSADKIVLSAFLVQMTKWESVKKVINLLEQKGLAKLEVIADLDARTLEPFLKSINFYKTKTQRILKFSRFIKENNGLENLLKIENRALILSQEGVGEETADSILLFAGHQPVFPATEYSRRVMSRVTGEEIRKREVPKIVENGIGRDVLKFKILHASFGGIGKAFCFQNEPKCNRCFLKHVCKYNYR
ncbi:endonuclease III domain-containing protein [Metallosphaera tengchongensis]|uniref:Endonuclease III domain-containing protein n=1 Tax=Metallosphaera tengchongensis TaxID=1532350 RepID=A0A6N0NVL1_9CREN|nr:endonuclease III domain-containing protein [Metallosphaera tengchongensis]